MNGTELIIAERQRQIAVEGWTPEHDAEHVMGEMIGAAITYAGHALEIVSDHELPTADSEEYWPWEKKWWKPSPDPIRNLVIAGALIAAEIDRLTQPAAPTCEDCNRCARQAYSDATTPGFFHDKCERHRTQPAAKEEN